MTRPVPFAVNGVVVAAAGVRARRTALTWTAAGTAGFAAALLLSACDDPSAPALSPDLLAARLTVVSGGDQRFAAGRRSPEPFRVMALDGAGRPAGGVTVSFALSGSVGGTLSQPAALTDPSGVAETYLLDASPGMGSVDATSGAATAAFPVTVDRAPGEIRWEPGTGALGVPGLPHPDSVLAVRVLDTGGLPMEGVTVWFAASGTLSNFADTTDADGRATVVLRETRLDAGAGTVFAFILGFAEVTATASRPLEPVAERVVVVSVEGLRADAVTRYGPPTLSRLAAEGASLLATTVLPTLTVPAHLSMWSGVSPDRHGVQNDTLRFTPEMASLNPVFKRSREGGFGAAAFVSDQGPLSGFGELLSCRLAFGLDSLALVPPTARAAVDGALPSIAASDLELLFLHLPDPDGAGHRFGFTSAQYGEAVQAVDSALSDLVDALDPATTLLLVTAPHGGGGAFGDRLHGSSHPADREIPLILWGAGARAGASGLASVLDVAPTALWALGMAPPPEYEGRVLLEVFDPTP